MKANIPKGMGGPQNMQAMIRQAQKMQDDKALMKAVSQAVDVDEADKKIKAVSVIKTEVVETLYGMSELEFIKAAKVLPPRAQTND